MEQCATQHWYALRPPQCSYVLIQPDPDECVYPLVRSKDIIGTCAWGCLAFFASRGLCLHVGKSSRYLFSFLYQTYNASSHMTFECNQNQNNNWKRKQWTRWTLVIFTQNDCPWCYNVGRCIIQSYQGSQHLSPLHIRSINQVGPIFLSQ